MEISKQELDEVFKKQDTANDSKPSKRLSIDQIVPQLHEDKVVAVKEIGLTDEEETLLCEVVEPPMDIVSEDMKELNKKHQLRKFIESQEKAKSDEHEPELKLTKESVYILSEIKEKSTKLTLNLIMKLCEDPFFKGKLSVSRTAFGFKISAVNRSNGRVGSCGAHRIFFQVMLWK